MGKIPESTPFKISHFVFRFRESSNKFVVEVLTQNLAFNLSGALFFIGLGCSLKWWYKDQLVIALLKQNLPALSEPQQKLSWETGEFLIGEQTRQFVEKNFHTSLPLNPLSGATTQAIWNSETDKKTYPSTSLIRGEDHIREYECGGEQNYETFGTFNYLMERLDVYSNSLVVNFKSPWQKHAYQRYVGVFPELDSELAFIPKGHIRDYDENQFIAFKNYKKTNNSLNPTPNEKEIVAFNKKNSGLYKIDKNAEMETFLNANLTPLSSPPGKNMVTRTQRWENSDPFRGENGLKIPFYKYTFWEPPQNWFQISARGLCILDGEYLLKPGIFTFLKEPIKRTSVFPLNAHCEMPQRVLASVSDLPSIFGIKNIWNKEYGIYEYGKEGNENGSSKRVASLKTKTQTRRPFFKTNTSTSPSSLVVTNMVSNGFAMLCNKGHLTKNQAQSSQHSFGFLQSDSMILNTGLAELSTILGDQFLVENLSYPLELTTTMSGWQPPVNTLILSSYLDEIPYKLQGIPSSLLCKKENQFLSFDIAKPSSIVNKKAATEFNGNWTNENVITNMALGGHHTCKYNMVFNKLQFIEIKQLLKNELQSLINSLPLTFVDQSFGSELAHGDDISFSVNGIDKEEGTKSYNEYSMYFPNGPIRDYGFEVNASESKEKADLSFQDSVENEQNASKDSKGVLPLSPYSFKYEYGNSFSLLNNLGITFNNLSSLKIPPILLCAKLPPVPSLPLYSKKQNFSKYWGPRSVRIMGVNKDASFWMWNKQKTGKVNIQSDNIANHTNFRLNPITLTWEVWCSQKEKRSCDHHIRDYPLDCVNKITLKQKRITITDNDNINQIDNEINVANKKSKLMSGYIYPDTQSNVLRNDLQRWVQFQFFPQSVFEIFHLVSGPPGFSEDKNELENKVHKSIRIWPLGNKYNKSIENTERGIVNTNIYDSIRIYGGKALGKGKQLFTNATFVNRKKKENYKDSVFIQLLPDGNVIPHKKTFLVGVFTNIYEKAITCEAPLWGRGGQGDKEEYGLSPLTSSTPLLPSPIILSEYGNKLVTSTFVNNGELRDASYPPILAKQPVNASFPKGDKQLRKVNLIQVMESFAPNTSKEGYSDRIWSPLFLLKKNISLSSIKSNKNWKLENNFNKLADKSQLENSLLYPKMFRGLSRLMDKACLAGVEIPLIPCTSQSTFSLHAMVKDPLLESYTRLYDHASVKQDSQEQKKPIISSGNEYGSQETIWKKTKRAAFPILQSSYPHYVQSSPIFGLRAKLSVGVFTNMEGKRGYNRIDKKFHDTDLLSPENILLNQNHVDDTNKQSEFFDSFLHATYFPFSLPIQRHQPSSLRKFPPLQSQTQNKNDKRERAIVTNMATPSIYQLGPQSHNSFANIGGNSYIRDYDPWKMDNHLAFFPGFTKPNTTFGNSLSQIAQGNDKGISKEHNAAQNKNILYKFDCSPRKIAYRGIVAQRDKVTKDFQSPTKTLKLRSILGTALFGPENPLTDRQSHFFGQRRLSTIDTNAFQRDYLRQLGKETLTQSNPKGLVERATSVERVKLLSFSKAINSFSLKKRKYTYLLEEKDQWHLLFQEQLRNALEDTRKYPPLTLEETKHLGPGRIKVSAPLMMTCFPKRRHSHKVLAQLPERVFPSVNTNLVFAKLPLRGNGGYGGKGQEEYENESLLPKIVSHYPLFSETSSLELNSIPRLRKNSLPFFDNLRCQEPLNANSWSIITQWSFLVALLFWIEQIFLGNICPALFSLEQLLLGATGMRSNDRTHVIRVSKGDTPKFQHIAGVDGLLGELAELVLFLRGHKERLWNKKSSCGVLLTGPPGTGKTFLVRALANEAKVPVLILSAGTLTASKTNGSKPSWSIRHAFRRAKQLAPCILFIDEIDALGRSRGKVVTDINEIVADTNFSQNKTAISENLLSSGSTLSQAAHPVPGISNEKPLLFNKNMVHKEFPEGISLCKDETSHLVVPPYLRIGSHVNKNGEAVEKNKAVGASNHDNSNENIKRKFGPLTQLLVSMDGVSNLSGVLIMGATNRPESLDPALTRPGRFERIIRVEKPAEQKRIEILQLYSRNLGIQQKIPWSYLANRTVGLTAADLAVAMNYSSLKAIVQGTVHTIETIEYGLDSIARFSTTSSMKHKTNWPLSFYTPSSPVPPLPQRGASQVLGTIFLNNNEGIDEYGGPQIPRSPDHQLSCCDAEKELLLFTPLLPKGNLEGGIQVHPPFPPEGGLRKGLAIMGLPKKASSKTSKKVFTNVVIRNMAPLGIKYIPQVSKPLKEMSHLDGKNVLTSSLVNPINDTQKETVYIEAESPHSMKDLKKWLQRLAQIAYYQAGKIVVQTLLPLHPPVALISLDLSGTTTATSADTHIPMDGNTHWCSFLESRLIGLYGGKAASLWLNRQHLVNGVFDPNPLTPVPPISPSFPQRGSFAIASQQLRKQRPFGKYSSLANVKVKETRGDTIFQSNIGTQEIHTATRLAATMVNNWGFYSSKSLKLQNDTPISPDFGLNPHHIILSECGKYEYGPLGTSTFFPRGEKSGEFRTYTSYRGYRSKSIRFTGKFPDLVNFARETDGINENITSFYNQLLTPARNFVSNNSQELTYSSLANNRPLRSLKSHVRCLKRKNTLAIDSHGDIHEYDHEYGLNSNLSNRIPGTGDHILSEYLLHKTKFTESLVSTNMVATNYFNPRLSYSHRRLSVENVAMRISPIRMDVFHLVNPLQFSIAQRDRFYPGWFRLYLPDIEATEFLTNVANYYYSLGLQTLTRPSLNEFAPMFLEIFDFGIQSNFPTWAEPMYHTTFFPLIDLCENSMEYGHTGNSLRPFSLPLRFDKSDQVTQNEKLFGIKNMVPGTAPLYCGIFDNFLEPSYSQIWYPLIYPQRGKKHPSIFVNTPSDSFASNPSIYKYGRTYKAPGNAQSNENQNQLNECKRLVETTSWNLRELKRSSKLKTSGTKHQIDTSFISNLIPNFHIRKYSLFKNVAGSPPEGLKVNKSKVIAGSPIPVEDFFFCCGGNSLSIGVGLLRSAAKRRTQLNVKNQDFFKPKQVSRKMSYPGASMALWGYSKPWNINRLINIGYRQEAIQYITLQPNDLAKEKNSSFSKRKNYLNKNVLFDRMRKKTNTSSYVLFKNMASYSFATLRSNKKGSPLFTNMVGLDEQFFRYPNGSFYSTRTLKGVNPKVMIEPNQRVISEKPNEDSIHEYGNQIDNINTKIKNPRNQLDLSLSFSLEKNNFPIGYNDASVIEKEWIYHSLVNNCFSKAFFLINQNRQLIDYFADYLVRFQILRQHQILYLFSAVLLNCKKQPYS